VTALSPAPDRALLVPIAGAWLVILAAQATGMVGFVSHDAVLGDGPPTVVALSLFLAGWLVMVVAMMLPASLPAVHAVRASPNLWRPGVAATIFVLAFLSVWLLFGLAALAGDAVLHRFVDATPWLAERPWLVSASLLVLAAVYQFLPIKHDGLAACRRLQHAVVDPSAPARDALRLGVRYGLACLASSWALMLVMFGLGVSGIWSMAALTGLMAYESAGRHGRHAATAGGLVLLVVAMASLVAPSVAA
jgi:predicted metal-binding membrane protein